MFFKLFGLVLAFVACCNAASGFASTCKDFYIEQNGVFSAECKNLHGAYKITSLNLNKCIQNNNGLMQHHCNGNFARSCFTLALPLAPASSYYLYATCDTTYHTSAYNDINLNSFVGNNNGVLYCGC